MPAPTYSQICSVAPDVIRSLQGLGVQPAFVGGMACKLNGCERSPNDLDILCHNWSGTQEDLKNALVARNSNFYLINSKNPYATYKVLWYRITTSGSAARQTRSGREPRRNAEVKVSTYRARPSKTHWTHTHTHTTSVSLYSRVSVKVDVLLAGEALDLSPIPRDSIDFRYGLPCAPLSYVLLYKVQAWIHHKESSRYYDNSKVPTDVADIKAILRIARQRDLRPFSEDYFNNEFIKKTKWRIRKFIDENPTTKELWRGVGYDQTNQSRSNRTNQMAHLEISEALRRINLNNKSYRQTTRTFY